MDSVIYLIGNKDDLSLPVKVGRTTTRNLKQRLAALQTGCAFELSVLGTFPGDSVTEKQIHILCSSWRAHLHGEWFKFTSDQINYLLDPDRRWGWIYYKESCNCND